MSSLPDASMWKNMRSVRKEIHFRDQTLIFNTSF
jgi:hypothetical protein